MADVFEYLTWRGDLPYEVMQVNEGDRLILSLLSFMDFDGIVSEKIGKEEITLRDAIARYFQKYPSGNFQPARLIPQNMRKFTAALSESRRFANLLLSGYRTKLIKEDARERQMQFAALCVRFPDHLSVIYRGTDDTLVGWKENFNSILLYPIPAQALAASYLEEAALLGLPLAVQGHSKGGNLAVYAAAKSTVSEDQILIINDYDGPGFEHSFFQTPRYCMLQHKIHKYLPEYSIIGLIRESRCTIHIVKSVGKGLSQHNGFHFQYTPKGLEAARRLDVNAVLRSSRLKRCLDCMSQKQKEQFIEGFYRLASASGRETVTDLTSERRRLLYDFQKMEEGEKDNMKWVIGEVLRQLFLGIEEREGQKNS